MVSWLLKSKAWFSTALCSKVLASGGGEAESPRVWVWAVIGEYNLETNLTSFQIPEMAVYIAA